MTTKRTFVQGKDGKMKGSIPTGGTDAPTPSDVPVAVLDAPAAVGQVDGYSGLYEKFRETAPTETPAPAAPISTGKQGTDIPPLVVQSGRLRLYVAHPDDKAAVEADPRAALAAGKAFPSITTCLGSLDKPALLPWATGLTAQAAEEKIQELADASPEDRDAMITEWLSPGDRYGKSVFRKEVTAAYKEKKDTAAVRGTEVHAIAEAIAHGEDPEVPEELSGYVDAVRAFRAEYPDMEFVYTEATVINRADGTMGTTDAIVKINGKFYVADYKSQKDAKVFPSTGMQLAAAANAEAIVHSDGRQEPMPPIAGGIGIGLGPDGKHNVYFFETERGGPNHEGFKASVRAWRWQFDHSSNKPVTRDQLLNS